MEHNKLWRIDLNGNSTPQEAKRRKVERQPGCFRAERVQHLLDAWFLIAWQRMEECEMRWDEIPLGWEVCSA